MRALGCLALVVCGATGLWADSASGTLYYTTFSGGQNLHHIDYNFNGVTFTFSNNVNWASGGGADGLLFGPNGDLLVGGQANNVIESTPGGVIVANRPPGGGSFHLALDSNNSNAILYSMNNGGCGDNCISANQLSGGGLIGSTSLGLYTVSGGVSHDVRGVIFDPVNNTWYYGTAGDGSTAGDFGTVVFNNVTHTAVLTRLLSNVPAHGLTFDPFTGDIMFSSANLIEQFHPVGAGGSVISTFVGAGGDTYDQTAVDGKGHLFGASNGGSMRFIDYDVSKLIGTFAFTDNPFLAGSLDDIAPIAGLGGGGQDPEPSSVLLLGSLVFGVGLTLRKRMA